VIFVVKICYLQSNQTDLLLDTNQRRRSAHDHCNHPRDPAGDHQDGSCNSRVPAPQPGPQHHPHWPALLLSDGPDILRAAGLGSMLIETMQQLGLALNNRPISKQFRFIIYIRLKQLLLIHVEGISCM